MSATIPSTRPPYAVVGVDGSPSSDAALEWALAEAQRRDLELELVGIWQAPVVVAGPSSAIAVPTMLRVARHHADHAVDLAAKQAADAGIAANTEVLEGSPGEVLLSLARGADQLIVGASGAGPVSRFLLGSVSTAVAHHAVGPVTVVRRQPRLVQRRVVVGLDGSECSRAALRRAAVEARAASAELHVVTAWRWMDPDLLAGFSGRRMPSPDELSEWAEARAATALQAEAEQMNGCHTRLEVVRGEPVDVLLAAAEHADLLVVGTRGHGLFDRMLLGSTSDACLRHAASPVQVVPAPSA